MTGSRLGIATDRVGNPHDVADDMDRIFPPQYGVPGYNETAFFTSWNASEGVGLFLHFGRCPQDIDLWYVQVIAMLPGGELAVERCWGRCRKPGAVEFGSFAFSMGDGPGQWQATFDGVAERTTAAAMARQPAGAGAARPLRFAFAAQPAGPIWDMYAGRHEGRQDWAKGTHSQQILHINGEMTFDGATYSLDGYAGNDHSTGVRELGSFASHHFLIGALPDRALHAISVFGPGGAPLIETGASIGPDGELIGARLVEVPPLTSLSRCDEAIEVLLERADGVAERLRLEPLHLFPLSLTLQKDNINGVDWLAPDHLVLTEMRVRVTRLSDGTVGHANLERSLMRSTLAGE